MDFDGIMRQSSESRTDILVGEYVVALDRISLFDVGVYRRSFTS